MLSEQFTVGPFSIVPKSALCLNGNNFQKFDIEYGNETLASGILVAQGTRNAVVDQLADALGDARNALKTRCDLHLIELVTYAGERVAEFLCADYVVPGMTPGLIDDRAKFWLRSADRLYSLDVTLDNYAEMRCRHRASSRAWIANLLPDSVLTTDVEAWRAPTSWEIRHIVGEESFTGISGAKAAALVGISPQNFRKYTAQDSAANRQNISYAAWHLLLHKLDVQKL